MRGLVIDIKDYEEIINRGKEIGRFEAETPEEMYKEILIDKQWKCTKLLKD